MSYELSLVEYEVVFEYPVEHADWQADVKRIMEAIRGHDGLDRRRN